MIQKHNRCNAAQVRTPCTAARPTSTFTTTPAKEAVTVKDVSYTLQNFASFLDIFDARFEAAIVRYQAKLGLQITVIAFSDVKEVFKSAFAKWGSVIPVSFVQTDDYVFADIKTGFYSEDHGDGEPFDGVSGVLAHSFSPESGKFHLDVDETGAIDFGLAHASVEEAVMHPSLEPGKKKLHLTIDDIQGVQTLYGSNPNFTLGYLLESDFSTNHAPDYTSYLSLVLGSPNKVVVSIPNASSKDPQLEGGFFGSSEIAKTDTVEKTYQFVYFLEISNSNGSTQYSLAKKYGHNQ
ncbi:hypothetical protein NC653_006469 [Populus alba x Populus x berolinensis]|uniref:Peptidase metallopeptidase domain-containing protein n=1 Tax=Populus alba x Populus x berolinensis TaxID=444605 RepID=A0AAD6REW2_9ROSI|nr:hypothetical protein NC653_006469 [Populus alba x Populus x berolinensis]